MKGNLYSNIKNKRKKKQNERKKKQKVRISKQKKKDLRVFKEDINLKAQKHSSFLCLFFWEYF